MKLCPVCGETKSKSEFNKNKRKSDGLQYRCRLCESAYCKSHYAENKAAIDEKHKEYYILTKDVASARSAARYALKREEIRERAKAYEAKNAERISLRKKAAYRANPEKKKARKAAPIKKGESAERMLALLTVDDGAYITENGLMCTCTYCGKTFQPTRLEVENRVSALAGKTSGELRFYCSGACKDACPIFWKMAWPAGFKEATSREVQPQLRKLVLARDNYTCQSCGGSGPECELHCHHTDPVVNNPIESADMDKCITYCKDCHDDAHGAPGCRKSELKCVSY